MDVQGKEPAFIKSAFDGDIGHITLNRPEKRNAIDTQLALEFVQACRVFADKGIKVCILDAEGQIFSAGADTSDPQMSEAFNTLYTAMLEAPFLWVACIAKPVIGAGLAMAAVATIVIGGPDMWVRLPEIKAVNKFPLGVVRKATPFVSRRWLMGMALSGDKSPAEDAVRGGLVTEMAARGEELATARRWAEILAAVDLSIIAEARASWLERA